MMTSQRVRYRRPVCPRRLIWSFCEKILCPMAQNVVGRHGVERMEWGLRRNQHPFCLSSYVLGGIICLLKPTKALLVEYRIIKDVARPQYIYCWNLNVVEQSPIARNNTCNIIPWPSRRFSFGGQSIPSFGRFWTKK